MYPYMFLPKEELTTYSLSSCQETFVSQIIAQNQFITEQNKSLRQQILNLKNEVERLLRENDVNCSSVKESEQKKRRKYTKRREDLEKLYVCSAEDCGRRYSSKIALNLHKRKIHQKKGS